MIFDLIRSEEVSEVGNKRINQDLLNWKRWFVAAQFSSAFRFADTCPISG